ncbi:MAG TPA: EAL domain-containing protein, partial [Gammaproteobacteria bacterium]|nr:EAL domain-containing protein [Gammaproteobacteria bacterium]
DDFGTGYSSLAYLNHFNVNGIKLDRFFIQDVPGNGKSENLLAMMIALGTKLDIPVVAEGVESETQVEFLREHGCSRFQGYLVAPALSSEKFIALLSTRQSQTG